MNTCTYAIHERAKILDKKRHINIQFGYNTCTFDIVKRENREIKMLFRTGIVYVILVLDLAKCSTDRTIQDNDQIDANVYSIGPIRHWTKRSISKATANVVSKLKGFWRVTMARDVLLYSAKFQEKIGTVKIYSKPGGWSQADKDIGAIGLADVKRFDYYFLISCLLFFLL